MINKDEYDIESLRAEVKELEEFTKHEYMSMKNWHEEKAELQAKVERYRKCLQRIVDEGWDRYGCAEALKQEVKHEERD